MTDEIASNPFADMSPDVPQETVRDYAAALVKNGMSVDEINRHLSARNTAPLVTDSLDMAAAAKERLINDPAFSERYLRGDPGAVAEMTALDLRIARGGSKLTDREPQPSDYSFPIGGRFPDAPVADVQKYHDELASFAADLELPADIAKSLVDSHLDAAAREGRMTEDQREYYGREQTQAFRSALGTDADARIKAAQDVLNRVSGRQVDLSKIVKSNGADVAIALLFQAEHLAATRKGR